MVAGAVLRQAVEHLGRQGVYAPGECFPEGFRGVFPKVALDGLTRILFGANAAGPRFDGRSLTSSSGSSIVNVIAKSLAFQAKGYMAVCHVFQVRGVRGRPKRRKMVDSPSSAGAIDRELKIRGMSGVG